MCALQIDEPAGSKQLQASIICHIFTSLVEKNIYQITFPIKYP
jgi:hypothetical protein